ncbi:MAG: amidohydrolase family protein [Chloroflexi bacterium]|nr:amidohydrolase family protein [Chloroflexota bacterium]
MTQPILIDSLAGEPSALLVEGDRITALNADARTAAGARRLDASGLRAAPGFIELQVNGIGEADITSDPAAVWRVAERLPRHGVTSFLATVVSSPPGTVELVLSALAGGPGSAPGAVPLGVHAEGPFISATRRGAHAAEHLRDPDPAELDAWLERGVRMVTLAPERPGGLDAIRRIVAAAGIAAMGHTDADAETTAAAIEAGVRYATHLFNAMPPFHHRETGAVGVLLDDRRVTLGLVGDGVHLDPLTLRLVARLARGRISLVSDLVADRLGGTALQTGAVGGRHLTDGTLAGGLRGLDHVVRTYASATGSVEEALEAVTAVPAQLLGLDDGRGTLRTGGIADIVLLDEALGVTATIVAGRPAFLSDRLAWP